MKLYFTMLSLGILTIAAHAGELRCYEFGVDSPAKEYEKGQLERIIGCYQNVSDEKLLAFVLEGKEVPIETAALVDNSFDKLTIKHFSRHAGKLKLIKQTNVDINPLPIPLKPSRKNKVIDIDINKTTLQKKLKLTLRELEAIHDITVNNDDLAINLTQGSKSYEEFNLPEAKIPSDGYWWPQKGAPMANGENSPMAKYDNYVKSVTGQSPNAVSWELNRHAGNLDWTGHCNGWVSAIILYGYDDFNLRDSRNNTVITRSDIQGLRSALSYCTRNAFYGKRNYGRPWNDIKDIYPHTFHRLIKYYIGNLQKPVSYDYNNTAVVDNHIISGYKFTYEETNIPYKYLVKAELRSHEYSDTFVNEKRVAPTYTRTYWYYLYTTPQGTPYKGEWVNINDHPDFIWIPLRESRCRGENPRISSYWLNHMFTNLERF